VWTYGSNLLSFVIFIVMLFIVSIFSSSLFYSSPQPQATREVTAALLWVLFSTNAFFAAIMSEAILINDQSIFTTTSGLFGSTSFPLLSPWIIYVAFYVFLTALLILISVYFVSRTER
jgi:hypothetical protein